MQKVSRMDAHQINVSDVAWSEDSSEILSGGFDHFGRVWDVNTSKMIHSYEMQAFVQTVAFHPIGNFIDDAKLGFNKKKKKIAAKHGYFIAGSQRAICFVDRRKEGNAILFQNDAIVNTLYVTN